MVLYKTETCTVQNLSCPEHWQGSRGSGTLAAEGLRRRPGAHPPTRTRTTTHHHKHIHTCGKAGRACSAAV